MLVKNMYYPNMDFKDNDVICTTTTNYTILKTLNYAEKHFIDK
ncbi:hypothetical protein ACVPOY_13865 [Staphylococcus aureus]